MANTRAACTCAEQYIFTSESVTEGHPDKVCDYIADSILDAYLQQDAKSRVVCEVLCKEDIVIIAGEITSGGQVDLDAIARQVGVEHDDVVAALVRQLDERLGCRLVQERSIGGKGNGQTTPFRVRQNGEKIPPKKGFGSTKIEVWLAGGQLVDQVEDLLGLQL